MLRRQCWDTIRNIKSWCTTKFVLFLPDEGPTLETFDFDDILICMSIIVYIMPLHYSICNLANRLHFSVHVYCNRSQMMSQRVKNEKYDTRPVHETKSNGVTVVLYVAVTSSVIYYSTHARENVIYLFYAIKIQMVYWRILGAWKKKNKSADVIWRGFDAICVLYIIDHGEQPMKMHTEVTLLYTEYYYCILNTTIVYWLYVFINYYYYSHIAFLDLLLHQGITADIGLSMVELATKYNKWVRKHARIAFYLNKKLLSTQLMWILLFFVFVFLPELNLRSKV